MEKIQNLKSLMASLKLQTPAIVLEELMAMAQKKEISYLDFALMFLENEIEIRKQRDLQRKLKLGQLPKNHDLDSYDFASANGITKPQLQQLRELLWLEQNFNLILMGPCGVGKTLIAGGLVYDALRVGYRALFRTMPEIIATLKKKDLARSAAIEYRHLCKTHLLVIDDMMMLPMSKEDANNLFQFVNKLHDQTSIIITTNKGPKEWAEVLQDEVVATALLDRLLHKCEIVQLTGESYRMANRKTIFKNKNKASKTVPVAS